MGERGVYRFVGVGTDRYADYEHLAHPVAEVRAVAERLSKDFEGEPLCDPDEVSVRKMLKSVAGQRAEAMIVLWSGHGIVRPKGRLALPVSDPGGVVTASDVVDFCAESGASQLLCIIDACYAGVSVLESMSIASAWAEEFPTDSDRAWFGTLVSASAGQRARDGSFGTVLRRLLKEGPRSADLRRRWSVHNRMVLGDDLGHAMLDDAEWDVDDQHPKFVRSGCGLPMIPNPLWLPGAPAQVIEHLLRAARGGASGEERSWFTGRVAEVNEVVAWVGSGLPGVRVVTGAAGTGKSAIVGRVVSVSNPDERARLGKPARWEHADPGQDAVHANAHARGLTVDRLAAVLDEDLIGAGVLKTPDEGPRNGAELVGALQRRGELADRVVPVVVVDGLDEARGEAFTIAADLLCRIGAFATVIVSTRDLPGADGTAGLVEVLSPTHTIDLDAPVERRSQREAIDGYIRRRLDGRSPTMDVDLVAARVGAVDQLATPFLVARIIADQLRAQPINTGVPEWESQLVLSLGQAFDTDLGRIEPASADLVVGGGPVRVARGVLTALTWGLGAGLPEPEWVCVATAVAGVEVGRGHISWVLDELGRYVVQDGEDGVAVYRLAHQSLADHLRPPFQPTHDMVFDPAATPIAASLSQRYSVLLADGHSAHTPMYLWRYAFRHAAAAGPAQVDTFRELTRLSPDLRPDLAAANLTYASVSVEWGHLHEAVTPTEEAVILFQDLVAENRVYLPDLAAALNSLGNRYNTVGRREEAVAPTEKSVTLYRGLATKNPAYLPDLGRVLSNLGTCYGEVGRREEAVAPTEEALTLYRASAAENPAYLPDLASVLSNLGIRYGEVGRREEAVAPTEEALTLYRALAAENPAYLPDLASVLSNLGIHYGAVGRREEAVPPTEEALSLYPRFAAESRGYLPNLAGALINLGTCYGAVGRNEEAVTSVETAVNLRRALAAENRAYLPDLAGALNNLGNYYSAVGRREEAVAPVEEALNLYRGLAAENRAYLPDLAGALNNLGNCYGAVGRRQEAVTFVETAVTLCRELVAENRAYLPNLAMALNNLSSCYVEVGRREEAVAPLEEALNLYQGLAAENRAYLPDLAMALNNLSSCYVEVGRREEAVAPLEAALNLYQGLAAENRAYLPNLATTTNNLAHRLAGADRGGAEGVWQTVIESQAGFGRAYLWWSRARTVPEGEPCAVKWLVRAEGEGAPDRALVSMIHECARAHRAADPAAWDRQWTKATGDALPSWLVVDSELLAVARGWLTTSTYEDEFTYLLDHPVLLEEGCDVALKEAFLVTGDSARYTRLRDAAREHGIHDAYHALFRAKTFHRFLAAEPKQQYHLLREHLDRLTHDQTAQQLQELIDADPDDPRLSRAAALISLADHNADTSTLHNSIDALDDPALFPALLDTTARSDHAAALLAPVVELALGSATTAEEVADALIYLACVVAITTDAAPANELLRRAVSLVPHRRSHWISLLADLTAIHPTVVALLLFVAKEPNDVED